MEARLGLMRLGASRLGYYQPNAVMTIAGVTPHLRIAGLRIRDGINDAPNTCGFTVDGTAPVGGQDVQLGLGDLTVARRLFAGTIQTVDAIYEGKPAHRAWRVGCTDYTALANNRRPFGEFLSTSATTIAQWLVTNFASGFTSTHVEAGLPNVSVAFNGEEDVAACVSQLAKLIGGYWYWDYGKSLHLFLTETTDAPDPVDATYPPLDDPPITLTTDDSQLRTRVFVIAHGEATLSAVAAAETIVPLADVVMFNAAGGQALSGGLRVVYTGTQVGGGNSLVGESVVPTNPPTVVKALGAGLSTGNYQWAATFTDAAGETLPSPLSAVLAMGGVITAPASAITAAKALGGNLSAGAYQWKTTFVDSLGNETDAGSSVSASITMDDVAAPSAAPGVVSNGGNPSGGMGGGGLDQNATYSYKYTLAHIATGLETLPSPATNVHTTENLVGPDMWLAPTGWVAPPGGWTHNYYRTEGNGGTYKRQWPATETAFRTNFPSATATRDIINDGGLGADAPTTNAAIYRSANLTGIPVSSDANVVSRKLWRTAANGSTFKLVKTIANNTATTDTDNVADASLGATMPTTNTTTYSRAALSSIPIGPTGTTGRIVYRTAVNGSQLKLLTTLANNTTTTYADSVADGSLGANAPTVNTSALVATTAEIVAGSTSVAVTSTGPFASGGGWAMVGQMLLRYTGYSGTALTGIPTSGAGAILTTIKPGEHVTAAPALIGVTGLTSDLLFGQMTYILVQRDDLAAQTAHAARTGGDGIVEYTIADRRIREDTAEQWADADLARFAYPITTVRYATRDRKTRSGKTVAINLPTVGIVGDWTIQQVEIDQIGIAPGLWPRYTVEASSVRFSLDDVLRRLRL